MAYQYNLGLKFYEVAAQNADHKALQYPSGESYTYSQINELSNKMARWLLARGVQQGDVIAIFNDKSPGAFSLMLGCLKIGAIYTNLDTNSPWIRLEKMIANCNPKIIFFDGVAASIKMEVNKSFPLIDCIWFSDETFNHELEACSRENLLETLSVNGANPAYIMFTSGSTGFPKGAVMSHSNLLNFIEWGRQTFDVTADDIFTNANPVYFDNSVFDFYISVFTGASLVPLSNDLVKKSRELVRAINASKCTIWFSVPSLLVYLLTTKALQKNDFSTIRHISFGGEGFPKNKLKQLYDLFGDRITLFNVYGPTECTCICSSYMISERDFDNMHELAPLGLIAPNFGYEILPFDAANEQLGELALTGPCVGLGYFNDAERTAQSFVQHTKSPFLQLMYKTGDLVERASNGLLHFRGRVDNQVKHMGYRIELEEVEAAFATLSNVNEAVVLYEKLTADLGQIKAFVSISDNTKDAGCLLEEIKKILPAYMVPRVVIVLPVIPKNSNGKIDRKQLAQLS